MEINQIYPPNKPSGVYVNLTFYQHEIEMNEDKLDDYLDAKLLQAKIILRGWIKKGYNPDETKDSLSMDEKIKP